MDPALSAAEIAVVQSAFYGDDELLRRQAFGVFYRSIDEAGKGGVSREALLQAVAEAVVNPRLSDFEMLESCAIAGNCTTPRPEVAGPAPTQAMLDAKALSARYAEAIARKRPLAEIMAIDSP